MPQREGKPGDPFNARQDYLTDVQRSIFVPPIVFRPCDLRKKFLLTAETHRSRVPRCFKCVVCVLSSPDTHHVNSRYKTPSSVCLEIIDLLYLPDLKAALFN